jgi:hypothetical protein
MLVEFNWEGILCVEGEDRDVNLSVTAKVTIDKGYMRDKNGDGLPSTCEILFLKAIDYDTGGNLVDWIEDNEELESEALYAAGE